MPSTKRRVRKNWDWRSLHAESRATNPPWDGRRDRSTELMQARAKCPLRGGSHYLPLMSQNQELALMPLIIMPLKGLRKNESSALSSLILALIWRDTHHEAQPKRKNQMTHLKHAEQTPSAAKDTGESTGKANSRITQHAGTHQSHFKHKNRSKHSMSRAP
jgi:hypothetical protein